MKASFGSMLLALYARRRLMLRVFLAIFSLVVVFTLALSPVFRAECKLIVTMNRVRLAVSPDTGPRPQAHVLVREEDLNSVTSILRGRELVRQTLALVQGEPGAEPGTGIVRRILGAPFRWLRGGYYALHGTVGSSARESQVEAVASRLSVAPVRRSSLIEIEFEDGDPAWASKFLATFVDVFLARYASTFDPTQAEEFFEAQTRLLLEKTQGSERDLRELRERVGIVALEEQRKSVIEDLARAESARGDALVNLSTARSRIQSLRSEVSRFEPWSTRLRREVQNDALQELKAQLATLEVKRADLLRRYTDGSERVGEIEEQLAATRAIIAAEIAKPPEEREFGVNPTHETLSLDLSREETVAVSLEARIQALDRQISDLRQRSLDMESSGAALERLERERKVNLQAHTSYLQHREAARLSNALNESQIVNVSVAAPVTTPVSPIRPKLLVNFAIGFLLAASAAVAAAFLQEYLDRSVKTEEDVRRATKLEVLAVVPERS